MNKIALQKPTKQQILSFLKYALIVVMGNAICSAGSAFFIIPHGFIIGGTTGLGIFVRNLIAEDVVWREWAVSITVYAANISLFLLGAFLLGRKFAAATLAGTLLYPSFLSVYKLIENAYETRFNAPLCADQPILAALYGGILFGVGVGMVVRVDASTGGTDVPPLIFHHYFGWPVSVTMWAVDMSVILLEFIGTVITGSLVDGFGVLYFGLFIAIIEAIVIDKVSPIGMKKTQVKIISKKYREIRDMILNRLNRGVTVLFGQTGYLKEKRFVILTIVSNRELVKLKEEVQKIDPEAFMTISVISEVRGRGFSSKGIKLPKDMEAQDDLTEVDENTVQTQVQS